MIVRHSAVGVYIEPLSVFPEGHLFNVIQKGKLQIHDY